MRTLFIAALMLTSLLLGAMPGFSQTPGSESDAPHQWSEQPMLADYLTRAARDNPELRAAFFRWQAARERLPQSDVLPDPRVTFGWFIQPVETRTGPQRFRYGLSQTLPWFGKRALRRQGAEAEVQRLAALADQARLELFRDVKKAYYEYAYLAKGIDLGTQEIELLRYITDVVQARYAGGMSSYSDILKVEVELGRAENRLQSLKDLQRPLSVGLARLMHEENPGLLPLPRELPVMVMHTNEEELSRSVKKNSPRLAALQAAIHRADTAVSLAEKNFYPDVTFGLESIHTGEARNPGVTNADKDPIIGSISFSIPLWQESRKAAVREAGASRAAAGEQLKALRDTLETELARQLYNYRDARRRIDLFRDTLIPKAEQGVETALEAFQTGAAGSLDLLNAARTFIDLELAHFRALADQASRMADIEVLAGREIPCTFHGSLLGKNDVLQAGRVEYSLK